MDKITFKYSEADWVSFTFTTIVDNVKTAVDLTGDTFEFGVKEKAGEGSLIIDKDDDDFNKDDAALGIVKVNITTVNNQQAIKTYIGELKRTVTAVTKVQKSYNIPYIIEPAVTT